MHKSLLLLPLFAAACSFPKFVASKTVELEVPLEQASRLSCETHNGDITVSSVEGEGAVTVRAEMKVRGHTQEEADANLHLLKLAHAVNGDTLAIKRDYPSMQLNGMSPVYNFTLMVPKKLALKLRSHNGEITTSGTAGAISLHTHNGDIQTQVDNANAKIETHNGDIKLAMPIAGRVESSVETHNGDVWIDVHDGALCWIEAHTHNGSIDVPKNISDATFKKRSVRCRIGGEQTDGKLYVKTHNGNVDIR